MYTAESLDEVLDLLGDVRDDLHRPPQILPPPLLVEHIPLDLAGGEVGPAVQVLVDKALVMAQIQIRLAAVLAPEGRRRDPFAKAGHHTAGHKYIFGHGNRLHF